MMKDQVKLMFTEIQMPDETARRIRMSMAQQQPKGASRRSWRRTVVLASILLLCLGLTTPVRAAVEELSKRFVFHNGRTLVKVSENGMVGIAFSGTNIQDCLEARDGRLYLVANGENRDITDEMSLETPYIYTYVDTQNVEHTLILGGTPDNFGYHEFYREDGGQGPWIGGEGSHYLDSETEQVYPWLAEAWAMLKLPWPLPGAN